MPASRCSTTTTTAISTSFSCRAMRSIGVRPAPGIERGRHEPSVSQRSHDRRGRPPLAALHRRHRARRRRPARLRHGRGRRRLRQRRPPRSLRHRVRPRHALSQQRRRHLHRRDRGRRRSATRTGARAPPSSTTTATAISICSSPTTSTSRSPPISSAPTRSARAITAARAPIARCPIGSTATTATAGSPTSRETAGISKADGAGLGVATGDYNGDGWLDLYVANDATPNQLWINRHDGTFADEGLLSGSALNAQGNPEGQHGHRVGRLRSRRRRGSVRHEHRRRDVRAVHQRRSRQPSRMPGRDGGWRRRPRRSPDSAPNWFDYDNDGWLDLFVANGAVNVIEAQRGQPSPFRMKNQLFRNTGSAAVRGDQRQRAVPAFARAEIGRGAAFGDIDNDGDVDIVVTNNDGPVRLLLNQAGSPKNHWLQVRARQRPAATVSGLARGLASSAPAVPRSGAASDRRQLSVGVRHARALRPGLVPGDGIRCRAVARRAA